MAKKKRSSQSRKNTSRVRVRVGRAWDGLDVQESKPDLPRRRVPLIYCMTAFAAVMVASMTVTAIARGDGQRLDQAWGLAVLLLNTALGWATAGHALRR